MDKEQHVAGGVAAGFITLAVAMGIGRFLYTPLLPLMLTEYGMRPDQAGFLASLNYVGYLVGAFSAGPLCHRFGELRVLAAGLFLSCLTTATTGLLTQFPAVCGSRLLAGNASALAFVAVSGLVLMLIARAGKENLAGLYYGGVGAGIVATGLAAPPVAQFAGAAGTWVVFGGVSALLSLVVIFLLRRQEGPRHDQAAAPKRPLPRDPRYLRLVIAYGLEGFGYIITGTFMVAAAKATVGAAGAQIAWVAAGCAAFPSAFLWSQAARKWGRLKPLVAAFLIQATGIVLPALVGGAPAVVAGALLFGATFMGIVTLALSEGASYAPAARARVVGFMTGIYGIGQIAGPSLAGYVAARTGSYQLALACAAATVVAAGLLISGDAFGRKNPQR
ncbi:YbfB/YjiJ family MFS transporter [Geomesophilobacter sediminis]|uniref:YbfB/YjiJ family MFS transporter n=1 Tax=Geomesophilobacter sediminis TaxID=2798584 RepID=A0A8J7M051_9BACT|nr:YbfB/YjiJ family MFS transporter [Geomesophilobacter sediminis]MBJ6723357.1 YbfB/YjiJ family MFS transporter [Geomesophilobacter sediminis]